MGMMVMLKDGVGDDNGDDGNDGDGNRWCW